ncbi:MAG: pseudouridine synthase [Phycisphaerales bacterium]
MPRRGRRRTPKHDYADKSRGIRLQKALAEAGVDSRRHCEELIEEGRVAVNGQVVKTLPAWVDPAEDRITVDGRPIRKARRDGARSGELLYLMLHKPKNTVCTNSDPEGRRRAIDLVDHPRKPRLFCVGRLDADSTGLLLFTNDGELANQLTHPSFEVHKSYEVVVRGSLDSDAVQKLQDGIFLADRRSRSASRTEPVRLKLIKRDRERTTILMELREGRNRQIRRMMASLGHPVKKLTRVRLGPLRLKGVAVGEWRPLTPAEIRSLKRAARIGGNKKEASSKASRR